MVKDGDEHPVEPRALGVPGRQRKLDWRRAIGPGIITGASDDDPSGIATYSQAGAQFGYGFGWAMVVTFPLMSAVQMVSARIGRVTGRGIAGNLSQHFTPWLTLPVVLLLLVANTINIGANLGAMADATALVAGGRRWPFLIGFALVCVLAQVFVSYGSYVRVLKWLTLSLLAYVATLFLVDVNWSEAVTTAVFPIIAPGSAPLILLVAIFGTTISPFLFFWQAAQEAEDVGDGFAEMPLKCDPLEGRRQLKRIELDTLAGMGVSNLVAVAIMFTCAATLNVNGITDIHTSAQAAEALRPIAGPYSSTVFALGIVGTGLLAVPVLAGSAAYAIGEALRWPVGLSRKPRQAVAFYSTIAFATGVGALINFSPIEPIDALLWAAVINGVVAVPVMVVMMMMAGSRKVMGVFRIPTGMAVVGWAATAVMGLVVLAMFWSMLA